MKNILTVYTGGTICSFAQEEGRSLNVTAAKRIIVDNFIRGSLKEAKTAREGLFEDSGLEATTLSENMTVGRSEERRVGKECGS